MSIYEIAVLSFLYFIIFGLCFMNHKEIQELKNILPNLNKLIKNEKNKSIVISAINLEKKNLEFNIIEIEKSNKILIPISAVCVAYIFMTFSLEFFSLFSFIVFVYLFSKITMYRHYKVTKFNIEELNFQY